MLFYLKGNKLLEEYFRKVNILDFTNLDHNLVNSANDKLKDEITPEELLKKGDKFQPHRSIVAWYCWRALDLKQLTALYLSSRINETELIHQR